jgi:hypothetical protein
LEKEVKKVLPSFEETQDYINQFLNETDSDDDDEKAEKRDKKDKKNRRRDD